MRGKVKPVFRAVWIAGITPAYAGKSFHNACQIILSQDHPRLCGEKAYQTYVITNQEGSPPPMRGKVHETAAPNGYVGITPAYAGKSMESADEPVEIQGSPPPMRGKDQ